VSRAFDASAKVTPKSYAVVVYGFRSGDLLLDGVAETLRE